MFKCALVISLFLGATRVCPAAQSYTSVNPKDGWKPAGNSNGIAIYSRVRSGSSIKEYRAIGEIDASTRRVHAVIDDIPSYPNFMPYTAESRIIKRETDSIIGYQRLHPGIFQDRDYTLRVWKKWWPVATGVIFLDYWITANELGPPAKKDVVRVKICEGSWWLEPVGQNKTRATYSVYTDSGGSIPAFLSNRINQIGIPRVFAALRKQVKNPKYEQQR